MGNLHLVTGHAGTPHVTAADHGSLHAAIFGEGSYVLNRGSKFATTITSNNSIRVADGDIIMQGRHIRLNEGSYVDLAVANGTQGMFRNDLIAVRYTKDSVSGVEDCNLVVIKGTAKSGSASDPQYTSGDIINDHVLLAEMPLYRIPLDGLNVQNLVPLYTEASLLPDGTVTTTKIASKAVTSEKLGDRSVTKAKLASGATYSAVTASLSASGWSGGEQTVSVSGVTETNVVIVSPDPGSHVAYGEANVRCVAQASGKLTFACDDVPSASLTVNIVIPT